MARIRGADGSVIKKCVCESAFQDKLYGKGKRVHTCTERGFRCTVCEREKV